MSELKELTGIAAEVADLLDQHELHVQEQADYGLVVMTSDKILSTVATLEKERDELLEAAKALLGEAHAAIVRGEFYVPSTEKGPLVALKAAIAKAEGVSDTEGVSDDRRTRTGWTPRREHCRRSV